MDDNNKNNYNQEKSDVLNDLMNNFPDEELPQFEIQYDQEIVSPLEENERNELLDIFVSAVPLWQFRNSTSSSTTETSVQNAQNESQITKNSDSITNQNKKAPTFIEIEENYKNEFNDKMKNKNTVRKTTSVMNTFQSFVDRTLNMDSVSIIDLETNELDSLIGSFILAIRKADGNEYEPDTLTSYHRGIDRFLRENGYKFRITVDREFQNSRNILANKRKELKQKGKGGKPNRAEPLYEEEENKLRENGLIGTHDPKALTNLIWLNNTKLFGMRGTTENHNLKWGDIKLKIDANNIEYLEFNERETKTRTGNTTHLREFNPKAYAIPENLDKCPVNAYKQFEFRRPPHTKTADFPFYIAICHNRKPDSQHWYKGQPLSIHFIQNIMKTMASSANLPGKKTNTSARKNNMYSPSSFGNCPKHSSTVVRS